MKVVGLITEYNPFHNGHKYHIEEAKRITGADYVVVVMSGNFVQRGTPAFMDKYKRTSMALASGADVVFELPVCYATSSAEYFALGSVSLLHKLGIVDEICFGSECGDIKILQDIAKFLLKEPEEYKLELTKNIKEGMAYPAARMKAVEALFPMYKGILTHPNNILGIEYMKALLKLNSPIKPVTIRRITSSYHSQVLSAKDLESAESMEGTTHSVSVNSVSISSATAIRKSLMEQTDIKLLKNHIPEEAYEIMEKDLYKTFPILEDDISSLLYYKLQLESEKTLTSYQDIPIDLANRIHGQSKGVYTFSMLAKNIKTKQWTLTRINRCLLHILLNIKEDNFKEYLEHDCIQYGRILGFRKKSSHLIRQIADMEQIPLITKVADGRTKLDTISLSMLNEDIAAAHLYNQIVYVKYHVSLKDEYTVGVIIV